MPLCLVFYNTVKQRLSIDVLITTIARRSNRLLPALVKTLSNTWADIRNLDSDFGEVKTLWYKHEGENTQVDTEEGLIEMVERVRIGEEQLREEKKVKEDLQKQDAKRSEAMMKKENIIAYQGKASFLEWAGTINKS